ncbi:hypothetical protein NDU88_001805 [Pleurodeles waltl]|uniref:Uncharacterized protein n=1 Tax=Pleurodeles waltl TaxID=8319 RepID=A0AAV7P915_PLEWA|nr:hypothetical protein NDU88_001805 [Pleurodeles waltl]
MGRLSLQEEKVENCEEGQDEGMEEVTRRVEPEDTEDSESPCREKIDKRKPQKTVLAAEELLIGGDGGEGQSGGGEKQTKLFTVITAEEALARAMLLEDCGYEGARGERDAV